MFGLAGTTMLALGIVAAPAKVRPAAPSAATLLAASANGDSYGPALSADGRLVAFSSAASNLVAGDTNDKDDGFARDRGAGTTERVSVSSDGAQANKASLVEAVSADARFVAFSSEASNLVPGDANNEDDVFVRDRVLGTTERVSVSSDGGQANDSSFGSAVSADGRFVAFESSASNLVTGDSNNQDDVFVRDRLVGTTARVNVSGGGGQANGDTGGVAISADGRFVVFFSDAPNLVTGDSNNEADVFVRDRVAQATERVSVSSVGAQANDFSSVGAISGDGRFVAFISQASNLVVGDSNDAWDVFVRDRVAGTTERVSVSSRGAQADDASRRPAISADGRFVAFDSTASNLVAGDTNDRQDVFVYDRLSRRTERVSLSSRGTQANGSSGVAAISANGRFVALLSSASNLVAGDTNDCVSDIGGHYNCSDVFVRDRTAGTTTLVSVGLKLAVKAGRLLLQPWPAQAGKRLSATMPVIAGGVPVASASVACAATLAGRKLPPIARSFRAGSARCTWQVPTRARGKQLSGSLSATTADGTARRRFAGTVR